MQAARYFSPSPVSTSPVSRERTGENLIFLPHGSVDDNTSSRLEEKYPNLASSFHPPGRCFAATTSTFAHDPTLDQLAAMRSESALLDAFLANAANVVVPLTALVRGNARRISMEELCTAGVPSDCTAVIVCARQGTIDPESEQAKTTLAQLRAEDMSAGAHAIAVLEVDTENGIIYGYDGDPYRGANVSTLFQVDLQTFRERVVPNPLYGLLAIPKSSGEDAGEADATAETVAQGNYSPVYQDYYNQSDDAPPSTDASSLENRDGYPQCHDELTPTSAPSLESRITSTSLYEGHEWGYDEWGNLIAWRKESTGEEVSHEWSPYEPE